MAKALFVTNLPAGFLAEHQEDVCRECPTSTQEEAFSIAGTVQHHSIFSWEWIRNREHSEEGDKLACHLWLYLTYKLTKLSFGTTGMSHFQLKPMYALLPHAICSSITNRAWIVVPGNSWIKRHCLHLSMTQLASWHSALLKGEGTGGSAIGSPSLISSPNFVWV